MFAEEEALGRPKYSLERITALLTHLGSPHLRIGNVVHVAGTNGKGSTIAYLRSIFECASYKVHTYTSPHLVHVNERIVLNGSNVSSDYLSSLRNQIREVALNNAIPVSFFEEMTAAAFLAFSQIPSDLVILETGLGGRLDATNVINPILTIITSISHDHEAILGSTLSAIAKEKAGIIKPGVPCVVSQQEKEVLSVLASECERLGSPMKSFGVDFCASNAESNKFTFSSDLCSGTLNLRLKGLKGKHQAQNASTALYSAMLLGAFGYELSIECIQKGVRSAIWPARLEQIVSSKNFSVTYDGAHNASGAKALAEWILETNVPINLVLAVNSRKDPYKLLGQFKRSQNKLAKIMFIPLQVHSSFNPNRLVEIAKSIFDLALPIEAHPSIEAAVKSSISFCGKTSILIAGSLYLAGEVYKSFK
jgi:dihydrofolate synthase / folylpolyglutamate synthase